MDSKAGYRQNEHIFQLLLWCKWICLINYLRERESGALSMECVSMCVCMCAYTFHPALKARPPGRGLWRAQMRHASVPLFKPLSEAYLLPQRCLHEPFHQLVGCDLAHCFGKFFLVSMSRRWGSFAFLSFLIPFISLITLNHSVLFYSIFISASDFLSFVPASLFFLSLLSKSTILQLSHCLGTGG